MRFLVIGASGFIGGNLLSRLRSQGFEAVGTQARSNRSGLVNFDLGTDRIVERLGEAYFSKPGELRVVICAAVNDMDLCLREREETHRVYVENIIRLIEDVRPYGARPVFLSTCYMFDGTLGYYNEDDIIAPVNEYARQKAEVEQYLARHVPGALVLRLDKVVGDDPREKHLFSQWYSLIRRGEPIVSIKGCILSPTFVGDVAEAICAATRLGMEGIHHVANPEFFHRHELAFQFCRALGVSAELKERPLDEFNFADGRALKSYLDGSRFARAAGLHHTPMREVFRSFQEKAGERSGQYGREF